MLGHIAYPLVFRRLAMRLQLELRAEPSPQHVGIACKRVSSPTLHPDLGGIAFFDQQLLDMNSRVLFMCQTRYTPNSLTWKESSLPRDRVTSTSRYDVFVRVYLV